MRTVKGCILLLLLAVLPTQAQPADESKMILLGSGIIDTGRAARSEALQTGEPSADEIVLVKFPGPITARQEKALREVSVRVYAYLPHYAFLVKMPAGWSRDAARLRRLGASWSGPYRPDDKMSQAVSAVYDRREGREIVLLHVFPDADLGEVVRRIREDLGVPGIVGWSPGERFSRIRLLLTPSELAEHGDALAGLDEVFWIDVEGRRTLLNDTTVWVGQSGLDGGRATSVFSQGIYGQGQVIAVLDTGLDVDMCWFRDPARGLPPVNACNGGTKVDPNQRKVLAVDFLWSGECKRGIKPTEWDTLDHGSHVAGTVAGDNFATLLAHDTADGMAPGAKLVIQDAGYKKDECGDLPALGCPTVDLNPLFQQAWKQGARIHTNSWGDDVRGYTSGSQDVDEFMWKRKDFLILFAAGNGGPEPRTIWSPSSAKNSIAVGATRRGTAADDMAIFSSCGPTSDGRIKPDVVVPGSGILSAKGDRNTATKNCGLAILSGTSMATPAAAGFAALVRQYYTGGWYPAGSAVAANGFKPSAALIKATLINSSVSLTGTEPIPGSCQGWGRVLLEDALHFTGQDRKLWTRDDNTGFATGSTREQSWTLTVDGSAEPLKVTLAWTDYPAAPAAKVSLVNDLDLTVTGPDGKVWKGNGSADRRNNVEQVLLASPVPGAYKVSVRAINVPKGPQPFALVVTGDLR